MQRLDLDPLHQPEFAQPPPLVVREDVPIDAGDAHGHAERGGIELRDHLRAIINNSARRPALVFAESFREKEGVSVPDNAADRRSARGSGVRRSEEHTSELQSLMRISYAVFCLKKKKKSTHVNTERT